ncbi:TIGR03773 family transporter-associated surface protein [Streptomyces nodosus]|uniref:TIGR03773 family transporter-associated surface protein n=1 Tax=Streptomyces nodosus TaxID=40318 RepID=UPI0036F0E16B
MTISTMIRTTAGTTGAALLLALATVLPAAAATSPPPGAESDAAPGTGKGRTVIGTGHIDLGPRFDHGRWTVQIRDDTVSPAVWRDTADVVLQVNGAARTEVPEDKQFGFLGDPGDPVWLLPQAQRDGVLWPGWNSQDPEVAGTVDREVTWQLTGVEGPGDFVLFLNGSFGTPRIVFDARRKLPQETGIEVNSHVHGNWAFTAPGTYLLDVRMSARTKDGRSHHSERTLRFSVGPQDPRRAFATEPPTEAGPTPKAEGAPVEPVRTDESAAPLWWGLGAAAAVGALAAALVLRRGRHRERPGATGPGNAVPQEGDDR